MAGKEIDYTVFGGYSLDKEVFEHLLKVLPEGSTIVELGSGLSSGELGKIWNVYSVEHNKEWLYKCSNINYIYAPIDNGWYDVSSLLKGLPERYDCLIIDGPPKEIGRSGFLSNLEIFKKDILYVFDDINRTHEYQLLKDFCIKMDVKEFDVHITSGEWHLGPYNKMYSMIDMRNG